jgi:hypothetical protein
MPNRTLPSARAALVAALLVLLPVDAVAQQMDATRTSAGCTYRDCAYNILARLHGLEVVRGAQETPVGTLGFLWTKDISAAFDGEGQAAARSAVRVRRWAALFTDAGLALLLVGAADAAANDLDRTAANLMLGGAASLGLSVPLQFRADLHLARAVWQHNARYAGAAR